MSCQLRFCHNLPLIFVTVPERIRNWLTKPLPVLMDDYAAPLQLRRDKSTAVNIELHPSMIPFVTQFRVEQDQQNHRKVLVTYANINHNKICFNKCAEITNNLAGNPVQHNFTQEAQIGQGLELFFYNWNKASCATNDQL